MTSTCCTFSFGTKYRKSTRKASAETETETTETSGLPRFLRRHRIQQINMIIITMKNNTIKNIIADMIRICSVDSVSGGIVHGGVTVVTIEWRQEK